MTEQLTNHDLLHEHELDQLELAEKATPENKMEHPVKVLSPEKAREAAAEAIQAETHPDLHDTLKEAQKVSDEAPRTDVSGDLEAISGRRGIKNLQRKESVPVRSFSKLVHAPVVRQASEIAGATVSRPSGMLGGGLTALVGTSLYLYLARHVGFRYNYLVFLLLFAGGFVLGLIIEAAVHLATASRRKAN